MLRNSPALVLSNVRLKIQSQALWPFASSMATCIGAGFPLAYALKTSALHSESKSLRVVATEASRRCEQGIALSEALAPNARLFPRYFLPIIRAGEAAGRLPEAFELISGYCQQVGPTLRLVRNAWLYPSVCIVFGWLVRIGICLHFGRHEAAWAFFYSTFALSPALIGAVWLLLRLEPTRRAVDFILLQLPLIREVELRLSTVLFLATFRLCYEAGGIPVPRIFDLAWQTVRNRAVAGDLLKARRVLADNGTFGDAFETVQVLDDRIKGSIHTGALSGALERSLASVVNRVSHELEATLNVFNQIVQRVVVFTVAMSIIETVLLCVL